MIVEIRKLKNPFKYVIIIIWFTIYEKGENRYIVKKYLLAINMTKEKFEQLNIFLYQYCSEAAHDISHVYRVLNLALDIAENEKVDRDILITATLLHDIARNEERKNPQICHAERGAELAREILNKLDYEEVQIEHIQDCIRTHRFRKNNYPKTIEAKILFDADKLDATGCIGIARTLAYKGIIGEPIYAMDKQSFEIDYDMPSFMREYNYKLSKIGQQLYTKRGYEIWEIRNKYAKMFYDELVSEVQINSEVKKLFKMN